MPTTSLNFKITPQHLRILANEMLCNTPGGAAGSLRAAGEVIRVRPELIAYTTELVMQLDWAGSRARRANSLVRSSGKSGRMTVTIFCRTNSSAPCEI